MLMCPYCNHEIRMRELPHQGLFKTHRNCPNCEGCFTPDPATKQRQAIFIFVLIVSLVFTLLLYFGSIDWLTPAIFSYVILGLIVYWSNKRMFLVPYQNTQNANKDS